jgi:PhnB protein
MEMLDSENKEKSVMHVQPYLFFEGRCDEALSFYRDALGAEVTELVRYKQNPDPGGCAPGMEDKVMHCSFRIGDTVVWASDGMCHGQTKFHGFSLAITVSVETEAERIFAALSEGGQVQAPLVKTFFSPLFGMTHDRFGVLWMIMVEK